MKRPRLQTALFSVVSKLTILLDLSGSQFSGVTMKALTRLVLLEAVFKPSMTTLYLTNAQCLYTFVEYIKIMGYIVYNAHVEVLE